MATLAWVMFGWRRMSSRPSSAPSAPVNDRFFRLFRKGDDRVDLGLHFCEYGRGIGIEEQVHLYRAETFVGDGENLLDADDAFELFLDAYTDT